MAYKHLDNVDFSKNQTLNRVIQQLGAAPASPVQGQEYWDTGVVAPLFWSGSAWINPFARANHTGTQLAATISNFAATVVLSRLDQMAAPTAAVSANNQNITAVADGINPQDAVNRRQLDLSVQSMQPKGSANAATIAALPANTYNNGVSGVGATLTMNAVGVVTVDGYAALLNDVIWVQNEATAANNGLYKYTTQGTAGAVGVFTRATNMDSAAKFSGAQFEIDSTSATLSGAIYLCVNVSPVVGTTAISAIRLNTAVSYSADEITLHQTGNSFSIKTTYTGQASITTLGTIATGVWNGTAIPLAFGGTGQTTKAPAFDALSPMTTIGDIPYFSTTGARLPGNATTTKMMLSSAGNGANATAPTWSALVASDIPALPASIITSGVFGIAQGGTGQSTATTAFNALSPVTTLGDIIFGNGAASNARLAGNITTAKQFLTQTGSGAVSAAPGWGILAASDIPALPASIITSGTIGIANGGTGQATAAAALAALGGTTKFAVAIGDGSTLSFTVTHNLNTRDVVISIYDTGTFGEISTTVVHTTVNTVTVSFAAAPAVGQFRVVVTG